MPGRIDRRIELAPSAWTPITRTSGRTAASAVADAREQAAPADRDQHASPIGASSAISSPIVPWPAMIAGWSNGGTYVASCSTAYRRASAMHSSTAPGTVTTSAPYSRVARSFGSAARSGMNTRAAGR